MRKYKLEHYLEQFKSLAIFPVKCQWKHICKSTIFDFEQQQWSLRINANDDYFRFRLIHNQLIPGNVWLTALQYPASLEALTFLAKLCCIPKSNDIKNCIICESQYTDELKHKVFDCGNETVQTIRLKYWQSLSTQFSNELCAFVWNHNVDTQLLFLLGYVDGTLSSMLPSKRIAEYMSFNSAFLRTIYSC